MITIPQEKLESEARYLEQAAAMIRAYGTEQGVKAGRDLMRLMIIVGSSADWMRDLATANAAALDEQPDAETVQRLGQPWPVKDALAEALFGPRANVIRISPTRSLDDWEDLMRKELSPSTGSGGRGSCIVPLSPKIGWLTWQSPMKLRSRSNTCAPLLKCSAGSATNPETSSRPYGMRARSSRRLRT
jgi:hypothetical protein